MLLNGTTYHDRTPVRLAQVLEDARHRHVRVRLTYGNTKTGRVWLEEHDVEGTIGRSMGPVHVPLIVHNRRSLGGPHMLDHCILRVKTTGSGHVLYQHFKYRKPQLTIKPNPYGGIRPDWVSAAQAASLTHGVYRGGKLQAAFRTERQAERYVAAFR